MTAIGARKSAMMTRLGARLTGTPNLLADTRRHAGSPIAGREETVRVAAMNNNS
jgi:hypothetical protein